MNCSACGGWGVTRWRYVLPYGHKGQAARADLPVAVIPKDDLIYRTIRESVPKAQFRFCVHCAGTGVEPVSHEMSVTSANLAQIPNRPASRDEMSEEMTR